MNQLSWLIYWADAAPKLSTFVCITAFFLFVAAVVGTVLFCVSNAYAKQVAAYDAAIADWYAADAGVRGNRPSRYDDGYDIDSEARAWVSWRGNLRIFPFLLPLFFALWGGSFLVPSKDTFYLIAASQAGEQAIKTPEFLKVRNVLNKWLDEQSGDSQPDKSDDSADKK
jgi:hypothetical protein